MYPDARLVAPSFINLLTDTQFFVDFLSAAKFVYYCPLLLVIENLHELSCGKEFCPNKFTMTLRKEN